MRGEYSTNFIDFIHLGRFYVPGAGGNSLLLRYGPIGGVEMIGLPTGGQDCEEGERVEERIEDWRGVPTRTA